MLLLKRVLAAVLFIVFLCGTVYAEEKDPIPKESLDGVKDWFILLNYPGSMQDTIVAQARGFDMAVLDPDNHISFDLLPDDMVLIGYVSIGEAESYRSYWEDIKDSEWLLEENPDWSENYFVDIRSPEWRALLIDKVIKDVVDKGFDGIMMDTIDTAEMLESRDKERYAGSMAAVAGLIKDIRLRYPEILILSNNGLSVMDRIASDIDGAIVEDINMMPDFENGGYIRTPVSVRKEKVPILEKLRHQYGINIFNIDYTDKAGEKLRCIRVSRRLGFIPYVAEKELDRIYDQ